MIHTKNSRFGLVAAFALLTLLTVSPMAAVPAAENVFDIVLWTDGIVHYKFDVNFDDNHRTMVRNEMNVWETAMTIADPAGGPPKKYITFTECPDCTQDYVFIRYNADDEKGNYCQVGMNPGFSRTLRFNGATFGSPNHGPDTVRHELGHCLGLYHDFNRGDADCWLVEAPDLDGNDFSHCPTDDENYGFCTKKDRMPVLGNYDYDSIMHYNYDNVTDRMGNYFGSYNLDEEHDPAFISERDKSRLLQYYAHELYPNWGFFESLSITSANPDRLPNPYLAGDILAGGVWAVDTPAVAFQSSGNYDIFARGSDYHLYWKSFRNNEPDDWISLGCCFGSDPSAVFPRDGEIDLVVIGAETGKLIHKHFEDGEWGKAVYVLDGYPTGGIKQAACCTNPDTCREYIGPAIASRDMDSLDVFVVRSDGLLAVTTFSDGEWAAWRTLGQGYNVTARPAAIALSATQVQLAINESDYDLYEPLLSFHPATPAFSLGVSKGTTAYQAPPALTKRGSQTDPYRVLITNADGRISHRFDTGSWRDIGGIPKPGTGPSAVATGVYSAYILMNGEDATGCTVGCTPCSHNPNQVIQPGGLWLREFEYENRHMLPLLYRNCPP